MEDSKQIDEAIVRQEYSECLNIIKERKAFLAILNERPSFRSWVMDSGCCFHTCSDLSMFETYSPDYRRGIMMGNGSISQAIGKGTVRIAMYNHGVTRLTDVVYVPGLKTNLISLGVLDAEGYEILIKDGIMRVMKGYTCVMKGLRGEHNKIYYLDGRTFLRKIGTVDQPLEGLMNPTRTPHVEHGVKTQSYVTKVLVKENEKRGEAQTQEIVVKDEENKDVSVEAQAQGHEKVLVNDEENQDKRVEARSQEHDKVLVED